MVSENEIPDDDNELEPALEPAPEKKPAEEPDYELEPFDDHREEVVAEYLEVEEPPEGPPPPAAAPPFPKPEPEHQDLTEEPPKIRPFQVLKFLVWPLRHGCGDDFAIMLFVLLVVLSGGWLLRHIPAAGPILQCLVAFAAAIYVFTYLVKLVRAAAEGRPAPVVWVRPQTGDAGVAEGIRAALLFVLLLLPAVILGSAAETIWVALPFVLLAWAVWPAALLNLAAGGAIDAANPVETLRTAMQDWALYLRIVLPGAFFAGAAFLSSELIGGVWFGLAMWLAFVYTAEAMGSWAYHDEKMATRMKDLSGVETDDGDEPTASTLQMPEEE